MPIRRKVESILASKVPVNKTDVRAWINMVGFYRRHVHYFSQYNVHLTNVLKKDVPFVWTGAHQQEFDQLKQAISNAMLLHCPIQGLPYRFYYDACDTGIGVVLCQLKKEGDICQEFPVCFLSIKLSSAEVSYPTVEKELLAVVYALFKLRRYLLDQIEVLADNIAVRYLFSKKEPNTRLQRWCLALQEYSFMIKHVEGKRNPADFLSGYPLVSYKFQEGVEMLEELYTSLIIMPDDEVDYKDELNSMYLYLKRIGTLISKELSAKERHYYIDGGYHMCGKAT